ncbi:ATP phosphoribosyltransferase [Spirochaeta dissipatitropha]
MVQKTFITEGMRLEQVQRHRQIRRNIEDLFLDQNYRPVETPLLDNFDTYQAHMSPQLLSDSYRLIDRNGNVMLLRSDVTLFLANQLGRHLSPEELPMRISYADSIVRYQSDDEIHHGETFQAGAELIGVPGSEGDLEILLLAAQVIRELALPAAALHIGSRRLLQLIWPNADKHTISAIADIIRFRKISELEHAAESSTVMEPATIIRLFTLIHEADGSELTDSDWPEAVGEEIHEIQKLARAVRSKEPGIQVRIDFSEVGAREYYSGMAFQIYCAGASRAVVSGGRYDSLLQEFGCAAPSVGFSILQSVIEPLANTTAAIQPQPISLALPKGRLTEQVQEHLSLSGIEINFDKRKLLAQDSQNKIKVMLVKNSDLTTYVHHGIAGIGVCGDDVIIESGHKLIKLHTFSFGATKMCLAAHEDTPEPQGEPICIATSYVEFVRQYFSEKGQEIKIIRLNGSVELAPILGLAPYIVDLVETGSTLKANNLKVVQELAPIRVHLVANPSYYKVHYREIESLIQSIRTGEQS